MCPTSLMPQRCTPSSTGSSTTSASKFPAVAEHLADARDDILAFTAFTAFTGFTAFTARTCGLTPPPYIEADTMPALTA